MIQDPSIQTALAYFQTPAGYFWEWDAACDAIEWKGGNTICFRKELMGYLSAMQDQGWPRLTPLLLVLSACKDNWADTPLGKDDYHKMASGLRTHHIATVAKVCEFLDRVQALPEDLRDTDHRSGILRLIFPSKEAKIPAEDVKELAYEFNQGRFDRWLRNVFMQPQLATFAQDMAPLLTAAEAYPSTTLLEHVLRSGLQAPPKPAEVDLPPPVGDDLMAQLLDDARTCGIAHLTQHLFAALRIPMRTQGSSDLPLGGVSDIANKGNLDRLLLSELAQDDLTLMARLANNEALYLRREEPPIKLQRKRHIFIDTTLRLWGTPKAFAVSAALGCALQAPEQEQVFAYALGGRLCYPAQLNEKEGVLEILERLDPHLDCEEALKRGLNALEKGEKECILITSIDNLQPEALGNALPSLQMQLDVLIALGRDGTFQLYSIHNGQRKLQVEAKLDLDDLLFRRPQKAATARKQEEFSDVLPAFFRTFPTPLLLPAISIRLRRTNTRVLHAQEIIYITEKRRVMRATGKHSGHMELLPCIEEGVYCIEKPTADLVMIVVKMQRTQSIKLYSISLASRKVESTVLTDHGWLFAAALAIENANLYGHCLEMGPDRQLRERAMSWYLVPGTQATSSSKIAFPSDKVIHEITEQTFDSHAIKGNVNPGYNFFYKFNSLDISLAGHLRFDHRELIVLDDGRLIWAKENYDPATPYSWATKESSQLGLPMPGYHEAKIRRATWKDGTTAYSDPRGFLHLRSSDPLLPEVTIVLVAGFTTAAWSSAGEYTGNSYFLPAQSGTPIQAHSFLQRYIQPILQNILRS